MGPKALELLAEELAPEHVSEVSLLSGPANVTDASQGPLRTLCRRTRKRRRPRGVARASCRVAREFHARVLFDEESVWELPPLNSLLKARSTRSGPRGCRAQSSRTRGSVTTRNRCSSWRRRRWPSGERPRRRPQTRAVHAPRRRAPSQWQTDATGTAAAPANLPPLPRSLRLARRHRAERQSPPVCRSPALLAASRAFPRIPELRFPVLVPSTTARSRRGGSRTTVSVRRLTDGRAIQRAHAHRGVQFRHANSRSILVGIASHSKGEYEVAAQVVAQEPDTTCMTDLVHDLTVLAHDAAVAPKRDLLEAASACAELIRTRLAVRSSTS